MLIASLLTLCLSAVFAAPSLNQQLDDHWHLWKSWHEKNYHEVGSIESVAKHKSIFNTIEKQYHESLYRTSFSMAAISAFFLRKKRAGREWCGRRT